MDKYYLLLKALFSKSKAMLSYAKVLVLFFIIFISFGCDTSFTEIDESFEISFELPSLIETSSGGQYTFSDINTNSLLDTDNVLLESENGILYVCQIVSVSADSFTIALSEDGGGIYNGIAQAKARVAYAGISVDYSFRDILDFGLNGNLYNWNVQKEMEHLLWLKPLYSIGFNARAKVFKGFHAMVQYNYEGRKKTLGIKADAVNELNLGAEYLFNDRVNVFLKLNNLLNKNYVTESGYPVQGFNVMAGVSLNF